MVQDLDILGPKGFFLFCTLPRVSKQGISNSVSLFLTIINPEVVTKEFWGLADFFGTQILRVHELAEVVVVDEHKHLMLGAL